MRRRDAGTQACGACGARPGSRCDTACPSREAAFTQTWNSTALETYRALAEERWGAGSEVQR